MKVLLTGSTGFVGSHLIKFIAKHKKVDELHTIIRNSNKKKYPFDHWGDLNNRRTVQRILSEVKPDTIIHFAANANGKPDECPLNQYYGNVVSTANLLEYCKPETTFIFASSIVVYGDSPVSPNYELDAPQPTSVYGASKVACESLIHTYTTLKDLKSYILRLPAIVGKNLTHGILYQFLKKIYTEDTVFDMIGDIFTGGARKPYLHIEDVENVIGHLLNDYIQPGIYNIAPSDNISAVEIAELLMSKTGIYKYLNPTPNYWKGDNLWLQVNNNKWTGQVGLKYPTSKVALEKAIDDNIAAR